ncbi:MAG: hypothetical protein KAG66_02995 [Methylococcales bacterium]|nr:hypothetical protein [Methylococcales bacterium]
MRCLYQGEGYSSANHIAVCTVTSTELAGVAVLGLVEMADCRSSFGQTSYFIELYHPYAADVNAMSCHHS